MRRILAAFGLFFAISMSSASAAASGLDVERWLGRPGVKLLAVEFYATWCKPCMEAVPRWKALHEKYRKDGLRLVVVATQDPQGGCVNPGWNPDDVVCDDEGQLAERFGASSLPSAYLWTWQGGLLVRQQHVDEVERHIETWLKATPRADVEVKALARGAGIAKSSLADLVRARLRDEDKITVVASAAERRRLDEIKKRSLSARYDDKQQCQIGMELSANSLLEVSVTGGRRTMLRLGLLSAEKGCLVASAVVDWNKRKPAVAVAEGVAELMAKLRQRPQMPWLKDSSGNKRSGLSSYDKMARELAAAKAKRQRLEKAWAVVKDYASARSIAKAQRVQAVERFLTDFPTDNPHETEARRMIASLKPPPPPPPPPRRAPPPVRSGDRDRDGLTDAVDKCPDDPEDRDGFEDEDGCPEPDNDRDRILDVDDKCPAAPETYNGYEDEDGCPDKKPQRRTLTDKKIVINEKVQFKTASDVILRQSNGLLDELAALLNKHPDILRVKIEGHTDSRGSAKHNLRLSERRAKSVLEALVQRGVARSRLLAEGYGEDRPIASNRTAKGRERNRRIEFTIIEQR